MSLKILARALALVFISDLASAQYRGVCTVSQSPYKDNTGPTAKCGQVVVAKLAEHEQWAIRDFYNHLRRKVADGLELRGAPGPQPPAIDMPSIGYRTDIAENAQKLAWECENKQDKCRNYGDDFLGYYHVGQSVGHWVTRDKAHFESHFNALDMIRSWYDEVEHFDADRVQRYQYDNGTARYANIVWEKLRDVGCGSVKYIANGLYSYVLVCNHGPTGINTFSGNPIPGEPVYRTIDQR